MMYSAYKLNKQGDNIQPWCTLFPIWNHSVVPCPVLTVASWSAYRFLKRQVRWSDIPISFRIFHMPMLSQNAYVRRELSGATLSLLRLSFIWLAACNVGDLSSIPRFRRSPGGGHGNPLQYSCLENPKDGGASWAAVHGVTKSQIWLRDEEQQQVDKALLKTSKGVSFLTLSDVYIRSFLYPFYTLKKTLLHKSSKWSSLFSGPRSKFSPPVAKNPSFIHGNFSVPNKNSRFSGYKQLLYSKCNLSQAIK